MAPHVKADDEQPRLEGHSRPQAKERIGPEAPSAPTSLQRQ
jgi:hypothetical protein